jgi:hypothetical protein
METIVNYIKFIRDEEVVVVKSILKILLKYGRVTIIDIRQKTNYAFDSNVISWSLKRLRSIGLVTYENRVWYFNNTLMAVVGYQTFQKMLQSLIG